MHSCLQVWVVAVDWAWYLFVLALKLAVVAGLLWFISALLYLLLYFLVIPTSLFEHPLFFNYGYALALSAGCTR